MFNNFIDDIRAHPFQSFLSALAGALVPGGGLAAHAGFNAYNNHNFNNAAGASYANGAAQGDQAAQAGFDRPLSGALGGYGDNSSSSGYGGTPNTGLFDQMQNSSTNGLFDFGSNNSMFVPDYGQSPQQVPNSPAWGQGVLPQGAAPMSHQDRLDYRSGLAMNGSGTPSNYGVSNFMANGQNVIFGAGDPNGRYRNRGYEYGG